MTIGFLGYVRAARGNVTEANAEGRRLLPRALELNHLTGIALAHIFLGRIAFQVGDNSLALKESSVGVEASERSGDETLLFIASGFQAWAQSRLGQPGTGMQTLAMARERGRRFAKNLIYSDLFAAAEAEMTFNSGRFSEAIDLARTALSIARSVDGIHAEGLAERVWAQALCGVNPPLWEEAEAHFAASLKAFESGDARIEAAETQAAWGKMCMDSGRVGEARAHFELASAQFKTSGLGGKLEQTRQSLAELDGRA